MALYAYRRVTRAEFEAFQQRLPDQTPALPAEVILDTIPADQRSKLLEVGTSVCWIRIPLRGSGTGWHLGNGWVVTNTHVICGKGQNSSASSATFVFPGLEVEAAARTVLFTKREARSNIPYNDMQVDLALIYVPEIVGKIGPLHDVWQRPANDKERVYLIHYGDGFDEKNQSSRPQQFSVCDNVALLHVENAHGCVFTVHSAHSRPGSSGAPLLIYEEPRDDGDGKFLVAGVNYCGTESSILDSPSFALWFHGKHWLQDTIFATSVGTLKSQIDAVKLLQTRNDIELLDSAINQLNDQLTILQRDLTEKHFRMVVPLDLPDVQGLVNCPDITCVTN